MCHNCILKSNFHANVFSTLQGTISRFLRLIWQIRVFLLRHRGIYPGSLLFETHPYVAYLTRGGTGEQHAPSRTDVTYIT